jgi:hypothetical protein
MLLVVELPRFVGSVQSVCTQETSKEWDAVQKESGLLSCMTFVGLLNFKRNCSTNFTQGFELTIILKF